MRKVEEVGRERGRAGDQAKHGFAPAQHTPGKPRAGDPHQQADEKQVEGRLLRRASVGDAVPPHGDQLRADHVGRVGVVNLRPRSIYRDHRGEDEGDPEPDPIPNGREREHRHQHGREKRDDVDHLYAAHPLHRRRGPSDRERQKQDQQDRPEAAAAQ